MVRKRKILTVLLLSAGCGTSSSPRSAPPTVAAPAPAPGAELALLPAVATTPPAAAVPTSTAPADPDAGPTALLELRGELYRGGRAAVQAAPARFRALCDAEGYPLVGNIASKGVSYGVRDHCADVRAALVRGDA